MEPKFSISQLARCRWNLLDLVSVVSRKSVPTYIFSEVDATWIENLRETYAKHAKKVSMTAVLLKAIAIAQRAHPASRSTWQPPGSVVIMDDIIAGFTVERFEDSATPEVFFGAIEKPDTKPLEEISRELRDYAEEEVENVVQLKAQSKFTNLPWLWRRIVLWLGMRNPRVRLDYMNATFALASIGKFGCKLIIPPCVSTSTFGVGAIEQRPIVRDGKIEIRPMFSLALNFDHVLIDGAPAARFLKDVCDLIEGGLAKHLPVEELVDMFDEHNPLTLEKQVVV